MKARKYLVITIIVMIFGVVGCENETVLATDPVINPSQWWIDRHYEKVKNVIPNQKIIFIGDSITQLWEAEGIEAWNELNQKYDDKMTNLGFAADETQHVIWRLENGEFPVGINPEYVVLMIGTNNAYFYQPESTAADIWKIVNIINSRSPSTKIILMAILPQGWNIDNWAINNVVNGIIRNYDGSLNIKYLDINQYYINTNGSLKEELYVTDYNSVIRLYIPLLHLSAAGYNIWKEKIIEIIE